MRSDSDSELSPSDSGEEEEDEDGKKEEEQNVKKEDKENSKTPRTPSKGLSAALYKTPAKKSKNAPEPLGQPSMVEEYFEAHGSSKVLTSDRTLERMHTPKLDRVSMQQTGFCMYLVSCVPTLLMHVLPCFVFSRRRWSDF